MTTVSHDRILGTLLSPGHVQRLSSRLEEMIHALPGRYQPFSWGVLGCDYVFEAGILAIRQVDAVMPNGVHVTRNDGRLRLDLRRLPAGEHLVYLTMTERPPVEAGRFMSSDPDITGDETLGDNGIELPRVRARLSLVTEPPASQDTSFPLLKVRVRRPNGHDRREDDWSDAGGFVPPTLRVLPDSPLGKRCESIAVRLRREAEALNRRANASSPTFASIEARAQLGPLVSALAGFEALLLGQPHPFALYVELCRLAGAVAVLRNHATPPSLPYDHNDAWVAFDTVAHPSRRPRPARCSRSPSSRSGSSSACRQTRGGPSPQPPGRKRSGFWPCSLVQPRILARLWGENCVIGSRDRMTSLESRRVLGLSRTFVKQVDGIPSERPIVLFSVTPDANTVTPGEDLLVLGGTPEVTPTALYLYVLHAKGGGGNA